MESEERRGLQQARAYLESRRGGLTPEGVGFVLARLEAALRDPREGQIREWHAAVNAGKDAWLPACGGTEEPFVARTGRRLLYCFNPSLGRHAYLDLEQDRILEDSEALEVLNMG